MDKTARFDKWNKLKQIIDAKQRLISFRPRDIYFISVGQNVGCETFGKGGEFLRPVLVYKKLSKESFVGIPMTSKQKVGSYFFNFCFKNKISTLMFNQMRVFDIKRVKFFYGRIGSNTLQNIEKRVKEFMSVTSPKREKDGPKGQKRCDIVTKNTYDVKSSSDKS